MKNWAWRAGGRFICVDAASLAATAASLISKDEVENVVGVGTSGGLFAQKIAESPPCIPVETVVFARQRERRQLRVGPYSSGEQALVVDDIMVSGLTLGLARIAIQPQPESALVGMQYASKTARSRAGFSDLRYAVRYCKGGGGVPPVNAVRTLAQYPERLEALCERYFPAVAKQLSKIVLGAAL